MPSYYRMANHAYFRMFGEHQMLHWPMAGMGEEGIIDCHRNLTDYCVSRLPDIEGKTVLDIGCGNGVQTIYLKEKYQPDWITGIDINTDNLAIARDEIRTRAMEGIEFLHGDAQNITCIEDESVHCITNIESAFHYQDKSRFIRELYRVLEPGGGFVISDICNRDKNVQTGRWLRYMKHFHWTEEQYVDAFREAGLELTAIDDVTDQILQGIAEWIEWLDRYQMKDGYKRMMYIKWGICLFRLQHRLMRTRRKYLIFSGVKL